MYRKVILICGMPRSGTSWLGQIFDSSADVAFRLEPLFSYRFKNVIDNESSREEIDRFFDEVYLTDDDFIHQRESRAEGLYCTFKKKSNQKFLVIKTTRHHNLLERYLKMIDNIDVISIVRHPCAVIYSWINTEREFGSKGCKIETDWKNGRCRKGSVGEYWGFDDWLSVTKQHMTLSQQYKNFSIIKYTDLVRKTEAMTIKLFRNLSIPYEEQTADFLRRCHASHHGNPYSVFKNISVENKWKDKLDSAIAKEIINFTKASNLDSFLV